MALDMMQLLEILPQLLAAVQIIIYVFLSWFFGSIAIRGMKYKLSFPIKIALTFCFGFACLVAGTALPVAFNIMQTGILKTFQVDSLIFGIIISIVFAVCLYMISKEAKGEGHKELSEKLAKRVEVMESMMLQGRPRPILESDAREIAKQALVGYEAKTAKLKGAEWMVLLEKGNRKASVLMGAFDGYVKEVNHDMPLSERLISDPGRVAGIIIIVGILVFSLFSFRGFPTISDSMASMLGMSPEDMKSLLGVDENLPAGCVSARSLFMKTGVNVGGMPPYQDEAVKTMFEQATGQSVVMMFETDYNGANYIGGMTIPKDMDITAVSQDQMLASANFCAATKTTFCSCMKAPSV
jgi:hypothetical protein